MTQEQKPSPAALARKGTDMALDGHLEKAAELYDAAAAGFRAAGDNIYANTYQDMARACRNEAACPPHRGNWHG